MKNFIKITLSLLLVFCITASIAVMPAYAQNNTYNMITDEDALEVKGTKLYNQKGEEIMLRGINLGGWLIQEDWFTPVDNNVQGDLYTMRILTERFGTEKTYDLYNIYQDNWITETDFKNIADMGFNCVRIPFWYRNFQSDDNGTWITDENGEIDLSRLEWAVNMCRKYGIYAILDLHAANGGQGYADHSGLTNNYHFFDRNEKGEWYREQAAELWAVVAERFAGDPAVAMFDLLNEPMCNVPMINRIYSYIWEFFDMAYDKIREKDPERLITMIATWDLTKLPKPSTYGWTGVIYQFHQYNETESDYLVRISLNNACNHNVPQFAGEFHPTGDKATLDFVINAYDTRDIMWTLWTYKGYNSWAAWADWFIYGSTSDELRVDPVNDSYEEIQRKWGEGIQTNSGNFSTAKLFDIAKKYLADARCDTAPYNTQEDVDSAVIVMPETTTEPPTETTTKTPAETTTKIPDEPGSGDEDQEKEELQFITSGWQVQGSYITGLGEKISPTEFNQNVKKGSCEILTSNRYVGTGTVIKYKDKEYTAIVDMDTNGDGTITAADARIALRASAQIITLSDAQAIAANANSDNKITASDARLILRKSAKLG